MLALAAILVPRARNSHRRPPAGIPCIAASAAAASLIGLHLARTWTQGTGEGFWFELDTLIFESFTLVRTL